MQDNKTDVIVVGGGMIGAAIAIGLAQQNYTVSLIEKQSMANVDMTQGPDIRLSAFNLHSVHLLTNLGAWQHVLAMRYREYSQLAVWELNVDKTLFDAKDIGAERLGYFVENQLIQKALYTQIKQQYGSLIHCINGIGISDIDVDKGQVSLQSGERYHAELILGADGAHSQVRQAANIASSGWQYAQHANAILIQSKEPLPDITWQQFHQSGPRALLPMYDNFACLVWYDDQARSHWIQQASKSELSQAIKDNFPACLPDFNIVNVASFGLTRMHAHTYGKGKAIILGDAAHTINPLAGQGVNLGFKDVSSLLDIIAKRGLQDVTVLIKEFEKQRKMPNLLMMSTMDALYKVFSTQSAPLVVLRNMGLQLANYDSPIKHRALKYAMGM